MAMHEHKDGNDGTGFSEAELIIEKFDERYQCPFFYNLATGKSGWTREEVESKADAPDAPPPVAAVAEYKRRESASKVIL